MQWGKYYVFTPDVHNFGTKKNKMVFMVSDELSNVLLLFSAMPSYCVCVCVGGGSMDAPGPAQVVQTARVNSSQHCSFVPRPATDDCCKCCTAAPLQRDIARYITSAAPAACTVVQPGEHGEQSSTSYQCQKRFHDLNSQNKIFKCMHKLFY